MPSPALIPTTTKGCRAEGDFRGDRDDADPDESDNDNPTILEAYESDSEVAFVADMQVILLSGASL